MLTDLIHWISSLHPEQQLMLVLPLLLLDLPRYAVARTGMCLYDIARDAWTWLRGGEQRDFSHTPSVCVLISAFNEEDSIERSIRSVHGSYPHLEIIVIDDGSTDDTWPRARACAHGLDNVRVLRKPVRGGKSSSLNFALVHTDAEIVMTIDADSRLEHDAIWRIVQPFADPRIGAVSGTILAWNAFTNLVTRLQALEYLQTIFVGRIFSARCRILGIASGAFGAFRRQAVQRIMGWDVGPGEDADITLAMRKIGYDVAHEPYAFCMTNTPQRLGQLWTQRLRWDRSAVRHKCRKHVDMAYPWRRNFRPTNLLLLLDVWVFQMFVAAGFWIYVPFMLYYLHDHLGRILALTVFAYAFLHLLTALIVLYYSPDKLRDARLCLVLPLYPAYQAFLRLVRFVAHVQEALLRKSFDDNYVPEHVRNATWHW